MAAGLTREAAGNELRATERLAVVLADQSTGLAGPNKPVLPTATTWLTDDSFGLGRRQTGQPLGPAATGNERRASKSKTRTNISGQRAMNDERQRAIGRARP